MTSSPLAKRRVEVFPEDPIQKLHDHVNALNRMNSVQRSGKLYFVARRAKDDGTFEHYVDRTL